MNRRETQNKSPAVADTGDRLATTDMGQKVGAAVPLTVGELGPHLTVSPGPRHKMAALPNIGGAVCESSVIPFLVKGKGKGFPILDTERWARS